MSRAYLINTVLISNLALFSMSLTLIPNCLFLIYQIFKSNAVSHEF